jgi:hypothetical protein
MLDSINAFFKKLKPEQQQKLLLTVVGTIVAIVALYYGLIRTQMAQLKTERSMAVQLESKVADAERLLKRAAEIQKEVDETSAKLMAIEETMAPANNDLYAWMFKLVTKFQEGRKVEVRQISREVPCEVGIFPAFPYAAIPASVDGQGKYHEIGKFIADFENQYPWFRVQNLELRPIGGAASGDDKDMLAFKLEIVALIAKPSGSN